MSTVLPINASALERAFERAFSDLLGEINPPFPELLDAERTPVEFLPYLGVDHGVREWDPESGEQEKRSTVAAAWPTQRLAGTRRAIEIAVESLGLGVEVRPWHGEDPVGEPYSLLVNALARGALNADTQERLTRRLEDAKAERDVLSLTITSESRGKLYYGAAVSFGGTTTVYPYPEKESEVRGPLYYGAAVTETSTTTVYPQ